MSIESVVDYLSTYNDYEELLFISHFSHYG